MTKEQIPKKKKKNKHWKFNVLEKPTNDQKKKHEERKQTLEARHS
jgi:hypothetical protein